MYNSPEQALAVGFHEELERRRELDTMSFGELQLLLISKYRYLLQVQVAIGQTISRSTPITVCDVDLTFRKQVELNDFCERIQTMEFCHRCDMQNWVRDITINTKAYLSILENHNKRQDDWAWLD